MRHARPTVLAMLCLALGLASAPAGASSFQLLTDIRGVHVLECEFDAGCTTLASQIPSAPFADFDTRADALGYFSEQHSTISSTRFEATLTGQGVDASTGDG